ncbi:MAG TPA: nitrilase-related carbon-nitrogen hydrolase [Nocardioidaceae bacterium]|nr:nitrilase-related carbon-nitrogen hydrolase [Nocardioidaceae bacterium]
MELAVVQVASSLEPADNLAGLVDLPEADLVVLPEAYARDFGPPGSDVAPFAQGLEGPFVTALVEAAGGRTLVAGMFERSEDSRRPFNTVVVVDSGGVVAAYRKIHLYDSFGYQESLALSAGATDQKVTFDVAGVRTGVLTCYDLRFPELARTYAGEVDLLVVPAAWVAGPRKVRHWRTLLVARAIENVAFVAGAAQAGPRYSGNSLVVDPRGDLVVEAGIGPETVMAAIDTALVAEARRENPSLDNRRL